MTIIRYLQLIIIISLTFSTYIYGQDSSGQVEIVPPNAPVIETEFADLQSVETGFANDEADTGQSGNLANSATEIVLLLENTTSIESFDNANQIKSILSDFITQLDEDTYVSIMVFAEDVVIAVPLTALSNTNDESILFGLDSLNFESTSIEMGRALERAVYELKYNGQVGASKYILLLTDESDESMFEQSILTDITDSNIGIIGVILIVNANVNVEQEIFQNIGIDGYSVSDISALQGVLEQVSTSFQSSLGPEPSIIEPIQTNAPDDFATSPVEPNVFVIPPATSSVMGEEDETRSTIVIVAATILIITLGALVILLYLRSRSFNLGKKDSVSEAILKDIHGYTTQQSYRLGDKATMLGRVAGKETTDIDYIVIPESTIGRRHAVIEYKDYAYWIMDQGSINGTFVNDVRITSEIRLKHGDIVRLHKYEFEFSIPELDGAGMTQISNTVMAHHISGTVDDADVEDVKSHIGSDGFELDLDFTGGALESTPESAPEPAPEDLSPVSNEETLLPGHDMDYDQVGNETIEEELRPEVGSSEIEEIEKDEDAKISDESVSLGGGEDETIMPGLYDDADDDDTIRPNKENSSEDVIDITGGGEDEK